MTTLQQALSLCSALASEVGRLEERLEAKAHSEAVLSDEVDRLQARAATKDEALTALRETQRERDELRAQLHAKDDEVRRLYRENRRRWKRIRSLEQAGKLVLNADRGSLAVYAALAELRDAVFADEVADEAFEAASSVADEHEGP